MENVRTCVRFRPLLDDETEDESGFVLDNKCVKTKTNMFTYDYVFDEKTSQEHVMNVVGVDLVDNVLSGYNACLFAYGCSGSGKSYSQFGNLNSANDRGIIPRCIEMILEKLKTKKLLNYYIRLSFLEIYLENIRDLFSESKDREFLKLREDKVKGVYAQNLLQKNIFSVSDGMKYISNALKNRVTASTNMNDVSSRSHAVLTIYVDQEFENETISSRLNLCDLCGSEDIRKSEVTGINLVEAQKINLSLTMLGTVIVSITNGNPHIPYRDSKLTFLLRDSLGGNNKTTILAAASKCSTYYSDTINTLKFLQRAKLIKNNPVINRQESIKTLKLRIDTLLEELNEYKEYKEMYEKMEKKEDVVVEDVKLEYYEKKLDRMVKKISYQQNELAETENLYEKQRELAQLNAEKLYEEQLYNIKLKTENDILKRFIESLKNTQNNGKILEKLVQNFEMIKLVD